MIWDRTTRILHWILAGAVVLNLFVLEEGETPHQWSGYIAAGAVGVRFLWGFFGGKYSRFRYFPLGLSSWKEFILAELKWKNADFPGHNPLAATVYILIWLGILSLATTGWMMGLDAYWGEEWLEELHANISNVVMALVGLHLVGLALDSIKRRKHVWLGMFTGKK